jgi:hypothetical protein
VPFGGDARPVPRDLNLEHRSVILKIHGAVDRGAGPDGSLWESFVITDGHYIEFLARRGQMPAALLKKMRRSHFLFLGYSLRDWNLRVVLHRLSVERRLGMPSWAVLRTPSELERRFWQSRGVEVIETDLHPYTQSLVGRL